MASESTQHIETVRREFTRQAEAYAANPTISDRERVERLVALVQPDPAARVLEVATGPGYVALGFAAVCGEVVGIDLTAAPLAIAERRRQERGLDNVRFLEADFEKLPFSDGEFDVVICRLALHHAPDPGRVFVEMARAGRPGATIAVEDLVASDLPERAAYQNRFERLRDPSHTSALPLSELLRLFGAVEVDVENVTLTARPQAVERWLANAQTPPDRAAEVRALIERDEHDDLSGCHPYRKGDDVYFIHRTATVIGRRLGVVGS